VLLIATTLSLLVRFQSRLQSRLQSILLCFLIPAIVGVLPMGQTDVSGFALAHMGTLSASMLVLLAFQLFANVGVIEGHRDSIFRNMNIFWVAAGMFLYPAALGLLNRDMYSFGFHTGMQWCVLAASVVAMLCQHRILGLCLAFTVLAHLLNLHESSNLWDYIIDPWLCISAAVCLPAGLWRRLLGTRLKQDVPANAANSVALNGGNS
jgi:hypothetical protein